MELNRFRQLVQKNDSKIVMLVMDGLGGAALSSGGETELEKANTINLDRLAVDSITGLQVPVASGITPGSGPGHLALFGYDPLTYQVGRGVLSALGIGLELQPSDVAVRGNFCTVDGEGKVTDRRAGRIETEMNRDLCEKLRGIELPGAKLVVQTVKEHRFALVFRGQGLSADLDDTDPQQTGVPPHAPHARSSGAHATAELVGTFLDRARSLLADSHPANMVLLRGFAQLPDWPKFPEVFGLRSAALAAYPMYRGLARMLGMEILGTPSSPEEEVSRLEEQFGNFDYFFVHAKPTDSAGEDGDFERKVRAIEQIDALIPRILRLRPDVLVVTGDHSTPSLLRYHSWHPVPVLLYSKYCRADPVRVFGERTCLAGGLGPRLPATDIMPLALAHALRLAKFGA